jgi:hypothetical protein
MSNNSITIDQNNIEQELETFMLNFLGAKTTGSDEFLRRKDEFLNRLRLSLSDQPQWHGYDLPSQHTGRGRPPKHSDKDIIAVGTVIEARGLPVTGSRIRKFLGGKGRVDRHIAVWRDYIAKRDGPPINVNPLPVGTVVARKKRSDNQAESMSIVVLDVTLPVGTPLYAEKIITSETSNEAAT